MNKTAKNASLVCIIALLTLALPGCRYKKSTGSSSFSHNFNSGRTEDLTVAADLYASVCKELEKREFKEITNTTTPDSNTSVYDGRFNGFTVTIEVRHLLAVSEDAPEFYYRAEFDTTGQTDLLAPAVKELKTLMAEWSKINKDN